MIVLEIRTTHVPRYDEENRTVFRWAVLIFAEGLGQHAAFVFESRYPYLR